MWMPVVAEDGLFTQRAVFTSLQGLNVAIGATEEQLTTCFLVLMAKDKNNKPAVWFAC